VSRLGTLERSRLNAEAIGGRQTTSLQQQKELANVRFLETRLNQLNTRLSSKNISSEDKQRLEVIRGDTERQLGIIINRTPGLFDFVSDAVKKVLRGKTEIAPGGFTEEDRKELELLERKEREGTLGR